MTETDTERGVRYVRTEVAKGRMNEAWKLFEYARDNAHQAEAEVARLTLLELADQIPGMDGMTFETQYEYDDEGGYFRTISCYPTGDGTEDYDGYEFLDLMNGFTPAAICVLCGTPTDADAGEITMEQIRERRF